MSSAISRPTLEAFDTQTFESPPKSPDRGGSPCVRPAPIRSPTGCRRRPVARRSRCFSPSGSCGRSGESAADTAHRNPSTRCNQAAPPRRGNVPCRPGSGLVERGKSSYHALKRAFTRSSCDHQFFGVARREPPVRIKPHRRSQVLAQRERLPLFHAAAGFDSVRPVRQALRVVAFCALRRLAD